MKTETSNDIASVLLSVCGVFLIEYGVYGQFGENWAFIIGGMFAMSVAGVARKR